MPVLPLAAYEGGRDYSSDLKRLTHAAAISHTATNQT